MTAVDPICEKCYNVSRLRALMPEDNISVMSNHPVSRPRSRHLELGERSGHPIPSMNPDASLKGEEKARYVRHMFGRIARRYDFMNVLMSFGQDAHWRQYTVRQASPRPGDCALDVATGTGKIALALSEMGARSIGIDFSVPMMEKGRSDGISSNQVMFVGGDALCLPFADDTFDCVTTGFAMRNVVDIEGAFREMRRVLKPGGRLVCLEVGRPRLAVTRLFHHLHTRFVVPTLGKLIAGDSDAYSYLPSSIGKFPPPRALAGMMRSAGLREVRFNQLTFGAVAVHRGIK